MPGSDEPKRTVDEQAERDHQDLKPLPTQDFLQFLATVTEAATCQACGESRFKILSDPEDPKHAGLFQTPAGYRLAPKQAATSFGVICANCGWLRFHGAMVVRRWVLQHKLEEESGRAKDGREPE